MKKILLVIVIIFFSCEEKKDVKLNLIQNNTYNVASFRDLEFREEDHDGFTSLTTLNTITKTEYLVKEIKENNYILEGKLKYIKYEFHAPDGSIRLSSKGNKNDLFASLLNKMENKTFTLHLSKSGIVEKIENLENIHKEILTDFVELKNEEKENINAELKHIFNKKYFQSEIEIFTNIYPTEKIALNETWKKKHTNDIFEIEGTYENIYKYRKLHKNSMFIDGSTILLSLNNTSNTFPRYNLKGKMDSKFKIHAKNGWVKEVSLKQQLSGKVETLNTSIKSKITSKPITVKAEIMISGY